jgi:hypothetical protein
MSCEENIVIIANSTMHSIITISQRSARLILYFWVLKNMLKPLPCIQPIIILKFLHPMVTFMLANYLMITNGLFDVMYSNNRVKLVPWIKEKFSEIHCHKI